MTRSSLRGGAGHRVGIKTRPRADSDRRPQGGAGHRVGIQKAPAGGHQPQTAGKGAFVPFDFEPPLARGDAFEGGRPDHVPVESVLEVAERCDV